ncbi:MAG: hypothetical protein HLX51_05490 [Micrococcaceae bacterium]|nr:hypothetical protein [Micrococcaceae bacterium]
MTMSSEIYATTLARLLDDTIGVLPAVTLPASEAVGWRLASDLVTQHPSPSFDNSQMDGYGIGYANLAGGRFRVGPDVPAGTEPTEVYHYGVNGYGHDTAVPIMTGAKIPDDVVAIVPVEEADPAKFVEMGDYVQLPPVEVGRFIRKTGSDMKAGVLVAPEGTGIDAALVATAASQGMTQFHVRARPRIAVIAGGDEIVEGNRPVAAKVFDANTPLVLGLARTHGLQIVATGTTTDDVNDFRNVVDQIIRDHKPDLIITSGGISEGKYEVVRQLLQRLDTAWVGSIEQQPGGPQGYGIYGSTPIVAVPGNPVSTMVSMRTLVLPALWQTFKSGYQPVSIQARINGAVTGIRGKTQYRRAVVGFHDGQLIAQIQGAAGSHLLAQAVGANALVEIPPLARIQPGEAITAHLFADTRWDAKVDPTPGGTPSQSPCYETERRSAEKSAMVIVASTRAAAGVYSDDAGPHLVEWLHSKNYATPQALVVADHDLEATMERLVAGEYGPLPDVLITSGGTGVSPTDQTVEVIGEYLDQDMPNVMTSVLLEGIKNTPHAALSRGIAGIMGETFVATLPGSTGGVADGIAVLDELIDHIVDQVRGKDHKH